MAFLILNYFSNNTTLCSSYSLTIVWFCNALLLSGFLSIYVLNPVFSLIFLIMGYLNAAALMLLFGMQFLVFVFLLIYVGAISILLLFVLMLLNLRVLFYKNIFFKVFIAFFIITILCEVALFYFKNYSLVFYYSEVTSIDWFSVIFFKNEIQNFGIELFLNNKDLIFLSAIFLFLILIASVNIVMTVKYSKKQKLELQLKNVNKIIKR